MQHYTRFIVLAAVIAFVIYRRIKNAVGLQKYSTAKLWRRIVIFSIVSLILIAESVLYPLSLIGDAVGIVIGLGLMFLATKNIHFEKKQDHLYYRTHIWVELAVLLMFFIRLSVRFYEVYQVMATSQPSAEALSNKLQNINDPYTGGVVLILCSYYISYFLYVLKKGKLQLAAQAGQSV